jgi:hypothetical protein
VSLDPHNCRIGNHNTGTKILPLLVDQDILKRIHHVLQDGDRVARLLIELEIPKAFFSRQIGFISIEHDDGKVDEPE